jgi:hypothetical protein
MEDDLDKYIGNIFINASIDDDFSFHFIDKIIKKPNRFIYFTTLELISNRKYEVYDINIINNSHHYLITDPVQCKKIERICEIYNENEELAFSLLKELMIKYEKT